MDKNVDTVIESEVEFNVRSYQLSKAGIDIKNAPSWYDYHKEYGGKKVESESHGNL